MTFGEALEKLKEEKKLTRWSWDYAKEFVVLQKGYPEGIPCNKQTAEAYGLNEGDLFVCNPYLQKRNGNGSHSMWVPTNEDLLADDWAVIK